MDEAECLCGDPPYTDGIPCDACLELIAKDLARRAEAGEVDPLEAICSLLVLAQEPKEDDPC